MVVRSLSSWARTGASATLVLTLSTVLGCELPERTLVAPAAASTMDVVLRVYAEQDVTDSTSASMLGWTSGLPGVDLIVTAQDSTTDPRIVRTDAAGQILLQGLPLGRHTITGRRLLTPVERAQLGAHSDLVGFVGTTTLTLDRTSDPVASVRFPGAYRRGLVLSEDAFQRARLPGLDNYFFGGFLELYNNSEAIIHLDGLQLADALSYAGAFPQSLESCADAVGLLEDPLGVWTQYLVAFPGSGTSYPVPPGGTVVVAMDAIDHRDLYPNMLDLRGADFEFGGGPDNPTVPDMIDLSIRANPLHVHGPSFEGGGAKTLVLALPGNAMAYPRTRTTNFLFMRVPGVAVVDVFSNSLLRHLESPEPGFTRCPRFVAERFDRAYGFLLQEQVLEYTVSKSRKVLFTDERGQLVLQHTRNSAADWHRTERTPGWISR